MIFNHLKTLGDLLDKDNNQSTIQIVKFKYLGLYFTADWCSSCVRLVKQLPRIVNTVNKKGSFLHLITLRMDDTPSLFAYNYWRLSKCNMKDVQYLANILKVRFIPTIIIYNSEGKLITSNGLQDMRKHGENTIQYWDTL